MVVPTFAIVPLLLPIIFNLNFRSMYADLQYGTGTATFYGGDDASGTMGSTGGWCNPPGQNFDLSVPAFRQIANLIARVIPISFQRGHNVYNQWQPLVELNFDHQRSLCRRCPIGINHGVQHDGVASYDTKLGANWQSTSYLIGQNLSIQVTTSDGSTVTSYNVAPSNWTFGQTFEGGKKYVIRVEEEETFRTVSSCKQFYSSGLRSAGEDDDVDKGGNDKDANKDQPGEDTADAEHHVECNNAHIQCFKTSHLENAPSNTKAGMIATTISTPVEINKLSLLPKSADALAPNAGENINDSNSNSSSHNLDSFVQDSGSPSKEEFSEIGFPNDKAQDKEAHLTERLDQLDQQEVIGNNTTYNNPVVIGSDCSICPSQVKVIVKKRAPAAKEQRKEKKQAART
ncbi:hypothetical protein RHGRI_008152 [Rhododendron griersonianum]|uniref:Expansin n=1 Tax=Rhododendron griersonianum TaxID=479676 RepID=A0AAV6KZ69_9ERIC|nr:hypothetical protein RHGRI_008152 [Rhododendron griersonianum]